MDDEEAINEGEVKNDYNRRRIETNLYESISDEFETSLFDRAMGKIKQSKDLKDAKELKKSKGIIRSCLKIIF